VLGVPHAVFLLQQVGFGVEKHGRGRHGGEDCNGLTELVVQATQGVDDERRVGDGGTAVVESVGEAFESTTVLADVHVALEQAVKLLLGVDGALQAVVEELIRDRRPRGVGSGSRSFQISLETVEYSHETMQESTWSHSGLSIMAAASTVPSMWSTRPNFWNVSSKKLRHCRKLPSSAERTTGTWLRMLSSTSVAAARGAGSAGSANGLEEDEPDGLTMAEAVEELGQRKWRLDQMSTDTM